MIALQGRSREALRAPHPGPFPFGTENYAANIIVSRENEYGETIQPTGMPTLF